MEEYQNLNRIEEGTYGVVYRARDKRTKEIVALKRLKMEREKEGFPITSLREINTLLISQHPNVVTVREIVVGSNMDKIYIGDTNNIVNLLAKFAHFLHCIFFSNGFCGTRSQVTDGDDEREETNVHSRRG